MKRQRLIGVFAMMILISGVEITHSVFGQIPPSIPTLENGKLVEVKLLDRQVKQLYQQGKYNEAILLAQRSLAIRERVLGEKHPDVAQSLHDLATLYLAQKKYDLALATYQKCLVVFQKIGNRQKEVEIILAIADVYKEQEQYPQTLKHYQQALAITRNVKNRSSEASILQMVGGIHQKLKQYAKALEEFQQALVIARDIKDRPNEATILYAIATIYYETKQYAKALEVYKQALPLFEDMKSLFPKGDPNIGWVDTSIGQIHVSIGQIYSTLGEYSNSQAYLDRGLPILNSLFVTARKNKNFQMESIIIQNLFVAYSSLSNNSTAQQQYQKAIDYSNKALDTAKQIGDRKQEKESYQTLVINYALQGQVYQAQQNYREALQSLQQALKISQTNGLKDWEVRLLLHIGQIYVSKQNFTQGLNYQQQAQTIIEQSKDISLQIQFFSTRGVIYRKLSRYQEALEDFKQAHSLMEKAGDFLGAGTMLSLIGAIYTDQNQYDRAINSYQQSQQALQKNPFARFGNGINAGNVEEFCAVAKKVGASEGLFSFADNCGFALKLGSEALKQPFVLDGLNSLLVAQKKSLLTLKGGNFHLTGQLYLKQKNYSQALASYQQALPILHQVGSPIEGATLGDLGVIYLLKGQYTQALTFSQQAVKISRAFNHRINEEDALYYLGIVYWAQGNIPSALDTLIKKSQVENENLANNLTIGSEERKRAFIEGKSRSIEMNVAFHLQTAPQNTEAAKLALTTVFQRKGRILDAVTDNVQRLRQNLQPEDRQLFDNLSIFRATLVNLLYDKKNSLSQKEFKTEVARLKRNIDQLEDKLAQRSTKFRVESKPVTIEAVQALIPADAALVEFIRYSPFNPKANNTSQLWGTPRYAAAIFAPKGNPKWIDLGEAATIEKNIQTFREYLQDGSSTVDRQRNQIARTLDAQLMQPLRQHIGNAKHLLLSPDAALNLIPFEALKDESDKYLIERYAFSYLTSGRDLTRFPDSPPSRQAPVIFSEINYDRSTNFSPLATAAETKEIQRAFPNAKVIRDRAATTTALKQIQAPLILHLATHGFFTPAQTNNTSIPDNPLIRSGIVLAGANRNLQSQQVSGDGILTGLEASGLDLYGTQLVVLSACETGLGDISVGEGIYGLRRALVIAGSQTQVLSLWKVGDGATVELMKTFYTNLKARMGRHEAFRDAQLKLLRHPNYQNPYNWAAFIPSGNWAPLPK
jgi:CHAT domain-containing protein/uncharacterized protein HemY